MTQKLKKAEIIPLNSDTAFKYVFYNENNMDIIENFVAAILDIEEDLVKGKVIIKNSERFDFKKLWNTKFKKITYI